MPGRLSLGAIHFAEKEITGSDKYKRNYRPVAHVGMGHEPFAESGETIQEVHGAPLGDRNLGLVRELYVATRQDSAEQTEFAVRHA